MKKSLILISFLILAILAGCTGNQTGSSLERIPVSQDISDTSNTNQSSSSAASNDRIPVSSDVSNSSSSTSSIPSANGAFTLPRLVADNMVLQRNASVRVWGEFSSDGTVTVSLNGKSFTGTCKNGFFEVTVKTGDAGGPYDMTLSCNGVTKQLKNILIGYVYICSGQSNVLMQVGALKDKTLLNTPVPDEIRLFHVWTKPSEKPLEDCTSRYDMWVQTSTMGVGHYDSFSALGYLYARELHEKTGVPIGIIQAAEGATLAASWLPQADVSKVNSINQAQDAAQRLIPSRMYNGMVHPLRKYTVKGVLWYQGESDLGNTTYDKTLEVFVSSWRRVFNNDKMTFTIVQLPRYGQQNWFELRELQKKAATAIQNCTYCVTIDCGEVNDIHPQDKEIVAVRAAQATLRDFYGKTEYKKNPVYKSHQISGSTVKVTFSNIDKGLFFQTEKTPGGKDWTTVTNGTGFEIKDASGKYFPATATLDGNTLVLTSSVAQPKGIRYAYGNFPEVSLFDKNGLPAEQFAINF